MPWWWIKPAPGSRHPHYRRPQASGSRRTPRTQYCGRPLRPCQFAGILSLILDTPIEDRTHLSGLFQINTAFSKLGPNETDAPTVFDAMKRLGLRLEKAEVPVETIAIDHANFKPIAN